MTSLRGRRSNSWAARRPRGTLLLALATAIGTLPIVAVAPGSFGTASSGASALVSTNTTHPIQHVVVIVLENELRSEVFAHAPYERYLASTFGNATGQFAACHPSAPNYLDMVAAVTNQCGSDAWSNYTNSTLGNLLVAKGFTWANYAEDLPLNACSTPGKATSGAFATRHVPFLFFASVTGRPKYCAKHILPSNRFNDSMAAGSPLNFSFYSPNLCDDGHDGCGGNTTNAQLTSQADHWLRDFLAPILNHTGAYSSSAEQAAVNHTAFLITWDEGLGNYGGFAVKGIAGGENYAWCQSQGAVGQAVCGGHVFLTVVSPYSHARRFKSHDSNPDIATTVEWLFGLKKLNNPGNYDTGGLFPPLKGLFSFASNNY
jgi:hypothetical protein